MHCLLSRQRYDVHQLFLSFIFGLITGLLLGGWFSKVEMAGVLQEAGDADSRARTRSQAQVELHLSLCLHLTFLLFPQGIHKEGEATNLLHSIFQFHCLIQIFNLLCRGKNL